MGPPRQRVTARVLPAPRRVCSPLQGPRRLLPPLGIFRVPPLQQGPGQGRGRGAAPGLPPAGGGAESHSWLALGRTRGRWSPLQPGRGSLQPRHGAAALGSLSIRGAFGGALDVHGHKWCLHVVSPSGRGCSLAEAPASEPEVQASPGTGWRGRRHPSLSCLWVSRVFPLHPLCRACRCAGRVNRALYRTKVVTRDRFTKNLLPLEGSLQKPYPNSLCHTGS